MPRLTLAGDVCWAAPICRRSAGLRVTVKHHEDCLGLTHKAQHVGRFANSVPVHEEDPCFMFLLFYLLCYYIRFSRVIMCMSLHQSKM